MSNKKYEIIAEQYLEVCCQDDGTWNVELVMESLDSVNCSKMLRHCLANFKTMIEGDEFADAFRFCYDKTIFEFELM